MPFIRDSPNRRTCPGARQSGATGELVAPGRHRRGVASAGSDLGLAADAPEVQRRAKLANWITGPASPLAARVMANRLWHYHFGVGIVDTPNDFGFNGGRPSHPELLDWLARQSDRRPRGASSSLQRTIVLSATYRQSGRLRLNRRARENRRRQSPAVARIARATGSRDDSRRHACHRWQLNPTDRGARLSRFHTRHASGSTFYDPIDPVGLRIQPPHDLSLLDSQRHEPFARRVRLPRSFDDDAEAPDDDHAVASLGSMEQFARAADGRSFRRERLRREAGSDDAKHRSSWLIDTRLCAPFTADADELTSAVSFVHEHGLPAFCRVIFNSDEFLYVD